MDVAGGKPVDPVPEGANVGVSVGRLSVMGLPSVEDGVSEVDGRSVREVVSVGTSSVLVVTSVVDGKTVGISSVLVGSAVVDGKTVGSVLIGSSVVEVEVEVVLNVSVLVGTSVGTIVGNVSVLIE